MIFLSTGVVGEEYALVRRWTGLQFYQDDHVISFSTLEGGLVLLHISVIRCMVGWIHGRAASGRARQRRLIVGNFNEIWSREGE
jgi:hypothetical protein